MPKNSRTERGTLALLRELIPRRSVTQDEARRLAELQANRLRQHLGVTEARFPNEALDLPRIRVKYDSDLPTSGMTFWDGSNWIIVLNSLETTNRQRFSLMHEFKHIIDHTNKTYLYGKDNLYGKGNLYGKSSSSQAERAADYFAACLLMPKMLVKRHWGQGPRTATSLAKIFGVSPAAMKYRLDQLGLSEPPRRCARTDSTYLRLRPPRLEHAL